MVTRTTISLEEDLHQRVARLLREENKRLNPLVNDLLKEWVANQERERYREQLRERFDRAFALQENIDTERALEEEWAEVDEESAKLLDSLE